MCSTVLFISGSEIFIILLFILIFFGSDKIPDFLRVMGKGVREFRKATDDIKREFNDNTSGIVGEFRTIQGDLTDTLTREISEPVQQSVDETAKTFDDYQQYHDDYYYNSPDDSGVVGNEYRDELLAQSSEATGDAAATGSPDSAEEPAAASLKSDSA